MNDESNRTGKIGRLLNKDRGEQIYWFETFPNIKNDSDNISFISPTINNLNISRYKEILLDKLKDTLDITSFIFRKIKHGLLQDRGISNK